MDEESLDRRAHWVQWILGGLIAATVFCVTLKLTVADLAQRVKEQDNSIDDITHRLIVMETIQACRDGVHNCK